MRRYFHLFATCLFILTAGAMWTACSSDESADNSATRSMQEIAESGYTWGTWIGKNIPIDLVPVSDLPDWIRPSIEKGKEVEMNSVGTVPSERVDSFSARLCRFHKA